MSPFSKIVECSFKEWENFYNARVYLTLVLFVEPCDWIKGVEAVFLTIALHGNVLLRSRYVVIKLP